MRSRSLQLRYELLGQQEVIFLENPLVAAATRSERSRGYHAGRPAGRGGDDRVAKAKGEQGGQSRRVGSLMSLSVNYLR